MRSTTRFMLALAALGLVALTPSAGTQSVFDTSQFPIEMPGLSNLPAPAGASSIKQIGAGRQGAAPVAPGEASPFHQKKRAGLDRSALPTRTPARPSAEIIADVADRIRVHQRIEELGLSAGVSDCLGSLQAADDLIRLTERSRTPLRLVPNRDLGTLRFLAGAGLSAVPSAPGAEPEMVASRFLEQNRALLRLEDPIRELRHLKTVTSPAGMTAVRFQQTYRGLDVWGHDLVVRLSQDGQVMGFSGFYRPTARIESIEPLVSAGQASEAARSNLAAQDGVIGPGLQADPELLLYPHGGELRLAWRMIFTAGLDYRTEAFVDAASGELLHCLDLVFRDGPATGSGQDLGGQTRTLQLYQVGSNYYMIDASKDMFDAGSSEFPDKGNGVIHMLDANHGDGQELYHILSTDPNSWPGRANAVSVARWASMTYDYLKNRFARTSLNGNGMNIPLIVNYKQNEANAFWNGTFVVLGNGDGQDFTDLAGELSVTAHEMGHGVVEHTANLVYEFEPGALNEGFADFFGVSCDFYHNPGSANWLIGEDIVTPGVPGDCLRNMETPGAANVALNGQQPGHMDEYVDLNADQDHGGVHVNSGIPNRVYYLVATAIGIERAEEIWYRTLSQFLVRNSQFIDFRLGAVQAAGDLYGADSAEQNAVRTAFDTVGIVEGAGTPPPSDLPDNTGQDFIAVVDEESGHILAVPPDWSANPTDISGNIAGPGGRPSFSDDGEAFAWVASDNNLYIAMSDGDQRTQLSSSGDWWGVALSPEGRYLAATTIFEDGSIYLFDLQNPQEGLAYELTKQSDSEGETPDVVAYADIMEFSADGQYIIYDALNRMQLGSTAYEYWDINMLRLADGKCFRVFQSLPQGEQIGNPTFAQNRDDIIAFDYLAGDGNVYVMGFDFYNNQIATITNNYESLGWPTFSGTDTEVLYQYETTEEHQIYVVSLAEDRITGMGDDEIWATGGVMPVWFTVGQRPTPVRLTAFRADWSAENVTLEWQVADGHELLGFHLERRGEGSAGYERRNDRMIYSGRDDLGGGTYRFVDAAPEGDPEEYAGTSLHYRLIGLDRVGGTRVLGEIDVAPGGAMPLVAVPRLLPNVPNPFRGSTMLRVAVPSGSGGVRADLTVFDVAGRLVAKPLDGVWLSEGQHEVAWDGRSRDGVPVAAQCYIIRLETDLGADTRKVAVVR